MTVLSSIGVMTTTQPLGAASFQKTCLFFNRLLCLSLWRRLVPTSSFLFMVRISLEVMVVMVVARPPGRTHVPTHLDPPGSAVSGGQGVRSDGSVWGRHCSSRSQHCLRPAPASCSFCRSEGMTLGTLFFLGGVFVLLLFPVMFPSRFLPERINTTDCNNNID